MAGAWFSSAVPDVQTVATQRLLFWAMPSATNAAQRSSTTTWHWSRGSRFMAMLRGAFLEPGDNTTSVIPLSAHNLARVAMLVWLVVCITRWYGWSFAYSLAIKRFSVSIFIFVSSHSLCGWLSAVIPPPA